MAYEHKTVHGFFGAHPERWQKGHMVTKKDGVNCFCLAGKAREIYEGEERERAFRFLADSIKKLYPVSYRFAARSNASNEHIIINFNDASRRRIGHIIAVAKDAWL